jgi:hypothetical protein
MMRHGLEARGQSLDFDSQSSTKILTLIVIIQITPPPPPYGGWGVWPVCYGMFLSSNI